MKCVFFDIYIYICNYYIHQVEKIYVRIYDININGKFEKRGGATAELFVGPYEKKEELSFVC